MIKLKLILKKRFFDVLFSLERRIENKQSFRRTVVENRRRRPIWRETTKKADNSHESKDSQKADKLLIIGSVNEGRYWKIH